MKNTGTAQFFGALFMTTLLLPFARAETPATLAKWTFEASVPMSEGPLRAEIGSGTAVGSPGGVWSNPVGNGSGESWSSNTWSAGKYLQFSTDGTGLDHFEISWAQVASNNGPRDFALSYSLDGAKFVWLMDYQLTANTAPNVWSFTTPIPASFSSFELDLPKPHTGVIYFRLTAVSNVSVSGGNLLSGGTSRIDDVMITAKRNLAP